MTISSGKGEAFMNKIGRQIVIVFFFLTLSMGVRAEETIRLTTGEYPPYVSETLQHNGYVSDIITKAFALEGITTEIRFYPWKRAYATAQKEKWDGTILWVKSPEREQAFYLSDPVAEGRVVFFYLKNYPFDWKTIDDLTQTKIGGTLGYVYGDDFENAEKIGKIKTDRTATDAQNFKKLLARRFNIFPISQDVGYYLLYRDFTPEQIDLFTHHPKTLKISLYHLLLPKKHSRSEFLLHTFNKGLRRLKESGQYDQIFKDSQQGKYLIRAK